MISRTATAICYFPEEEASTGDGDSREKNWKKTWVLNTFVEPLINQLQCSLCLRTSNVLLTPVWVCLSVLAAKTASLMLRKCQFPMMLTMTWKNKMVDLPYSKVVPPAMAEIYLWIKTRVQVLQSFVFLWGGAMPQGMQDLSSLTRDWAHALCSGSAVQCSGSGTTGPPRKLRPTVFTAQSYPLSPKPQWSPYVPSGSRKVRRRWVTPTNVWRPPPSFPFFDHPEFPGVTLSPLLVYLTHAYYVNFLLAWPTRPPSPSMPPSLFYPERRSLSEEWILQTLFLPFN